MFTVEVNHTYQFLLFGSLYGQQILNRFSYRCIQASQSPTSAVGLIAAWVARLMDEILAVQTTDMVYGKVQVRHLGIPAEGTWEGVLDLTGGIAAATYPTAPSFATATFREYTELGVSRSGWKRFAGFPQACIVDGLFDASAGPDLTTEFADLALELAADMDGGFGNFFRPCVVRNEGTPSSPMYIPHDIVSASGPRLGTQNSRKINYGD